MFDDFVPSAASLEESTTRFRRSIAAALVVYGSGFATLVAATATVRKIIEEKETQVEFAKTAEPEPPPPPDPEMEQIDDILRKIAETGQASLNDDERALLKRASERMKSRRRS